MTAPFPPRVIVAVSPEVRPRIRAILPAFELRFVELARYPADALGNARLRAMLERLIERARR